MEPLANSRMGSLRPILLLLMGAVGLMLLIACANVANLLLARNGTRHQEFAIRTAIGAGRGRLIRQLLTETLLLSLLGGGAGIAVAWLGTGVLASIHPARISQLGEARIDAHVLAFTFAVAVLTSIAFGILPALVGTRVHPSDALKDGGRMGTGGRRRRSLRRTLVVAEVALSLMLLIGAGLVIKSLARIQAQDLGFRPDHLLTEHLFLPETRYPDPKRITQFCDRFAERIREMPGVSDATVSDIVPPSYRWKLMFTIVGRPAGSIQEVPTANFGVTDGHYVKTLGIHVRRGRDFADTDGETSPRVVLVNDTFARRYFPNDDPIGKELDLAAPDSLVPRTGAGSARTPRLTIVGVIDDTKNRGMALDPDPDIIGLYTQNPEENYGFKSVLVRTTVDPSGIVASLRRELASLDPDLPFAEVRTMDDIVSQHTADGRFNTLLLTMFAVLGVALAVVGVYGVVACSVTQGRREIATRILLGAQARGVIGLVAREGVVVGILGIVLGASGALAGAQAAASVLYGVSPRDPLTFVGSSLLLALVVLVATFVRVAVPCTSIRSRRCGRTRVECDLSPSWASPRGAREDERHAGKRQRLEDRDPFVPAVVGRRGHGAGDVEQHHPEKHHQPRQRRRQPSRRREIHAHASGDQGDAGKIRPEVGARDPRRHERGHEVGEQEMLDSAQDHECAEANPAESEESIRPVDDGRRLHGRSAGHGECAADEGQRLAQARPLAAEVRIGGCHGQLAKERPHKHQGRGQHRRPARLHPQRHRRARGDEARARDIREHDASGPRGGPRGRTSRHEIAVDELLNAESHQPHGEEQPPERRGSAHRR